MIRRAWRLASCASFLCLPLAARAGDLHVPSEIALGEGKTGEVDISKRAGERAGEVVRFVSNVGDISSPREADGRLHVTYTPPREDYPRFAMIAVLGTDSVLEWAAIPLIGHATVSTKSKPRASVRVKIGDTEYGPTEADRAGHAEFTVAIPPGIDHAIAIAEDRVGAIKETKLALDPPPLARLFALCPENGGDALRLLVIDRAGQPLEGAKFDLDASQGSLSAPIAIAPGIYESRFKAMGAVGVTVDLGGLLHGDPASSFACTVGLPTELPTAMVVTVEPRTHIAGGGPLRVVIELGYPGQRLPRAIPIALTPTAGTLSEPAAISGTRYIARWTLPDVLPDREAKLVVSSPAVRLTTAATVGLVPGAIARLSLTAKKSTVRADGTSRAPFTVRAFDAFGNPVDSFAVTASAATGAVSEFRKEEGGALAATWVPPRQIRASEGVVVVHEPQQAVEGSLTWRLAPVRGMWTLGAKAGYVTNFGRLSAPIAQVDASVRPRMLHEDLTLGVEAGYGMATHQARTSTGEPVRLEVSTIPFLGRVTYDVLRRPVGVYLGATGGVTIAEIAVSSPSAGRTSSSKSVPSYGALVGVDFRAGLGRVGLEASWRESRITGDLSGNVGGLGVVAAYRVDF